MTEDEKILQAEFEKRWKRSPQKDGCLFSGFIALCLAQTLFAPDFPFRGLNLGDSAFCPWRWSGVRCAGGHETKGDSCECLWAFAGGLWRCRGSAGIRGDCARYGVFFAQ